MNRAPRMSFAWLLCFLIAAPAAAQPAGPAPSARPAQPAADAGGSIKVELAPVFESQTGGIALRPPAGARQIVRGADPDLIVEFVHEEKQWSLKVHRNTFSRAMALSNPDAPMDQRGILELTVDSFARAQQDVTVLRQEVVNQGSFDVGMLAMRYGPPGQRRLAQQAIFRVSDRVYFTLTFTSQTDVPAPRDVRPGGGEPADPREREAVATFNAVLDTVKLLDRSHIKREQDERLARTRALMVNFNEARLTAAAQKEQWLRLVRDGKDIGYMYVVEEPYVHGGDNGQLILIRSRTVPDAGVVVDGATSLWVSYSSARRSEFWVSNALVKNDGPRRSSLSEVGTSFQRVKNVRVPPPQPAPGTKPDRNAIVKQVEEYLLSVERTVGGVTGTPTVRDLPPYYLPQALGHLLPRLLPLKEPTGYLFVSWVSDRQELMYRYVDVQLDEEVVIDGRRVRAVPVADRLGLQGTPTIHYMSPDGRYLGSKTETLDEKGATVVSWILPTDARTLQETWKDAELTRPETRTPVQKPPRANGR